MNEKFSEVFRLRVSDYDCFDKLMPHAVLDLFQDVAGKHADLIGVGFNDLIKNNLIWVLVRTKYIVLKNPPLYAKVKATTWPKPKGRIDFDREYIIEDEKGDLLIKGISKWVVVNAKTRRISLTKDVNYSCDISHDANFNGNFEKLEDFFIDGCQENEATTTFSDLDHNGHVNNINYARFIINSINLSKADEIQSFEINYIKELPANTKIKIYSKKCGKVIDVKGIINNVDVSFIAKICLY